MSSDHSESTAKDAPVGESTEPSADAHANLRPGRRPEPLTVRYEFVVVEGEAGKELRRR